MRIVPLSALICLLAVAAMPRAMAQTDPADAWVAQRSTYLQSTLGMSDDLDARGGAYLQQSANAPESWWAEWQSHQPYSMNETYSFRPDTVQVPRTPDIASNVPYGRNMTELLYGKKDNQQPLSNSISIGGGRQDDAESGGNYDPSSNLPNGPSDANQSTAPVAPMPVGQLVGQ